MSFRLKLLLAMMLVIAGVTAATLAVTQRKVQAAYEKLHKDQFDAQVNYLANQQEARLSSVKEACQRLAATPELCQALLKGDPDQIYGIATNHLTLPNLRGRLVGNPAVFFRILDANGNILHLAETRARGATLIHRRMEEQLGKVLKSLANLDVPLVGFLWRNSETQRRNVLDEVVVTKISHPDSHQTIGAVLLGLPVLDYSGTNMYQASGLRSGIWMDNQLHSETIPENQHEDLSRILTAHIPTNGPPQGTSLITLGGAPQRLFYRLMNPDSQFPAAFQISLHSLAAAMRSEQELRLQVLGFAALALLVAFVLSLAIAHSLSVPLRELVAGTEAVRAGNFLYQVPVRSRDEVGQLAVSFNEMAEGLAQKEKYRTVLNMVADEKIAHELINGQLALGGEVREVTVLFCDIRGFTALTEGMPPQEVIELLNEHMTALRRIVKEHDGVLDKFVGDLLMAVFGAPIKTDHDAINAARCALGLIHERAKLNQTARHKLQVGIGIATGNVVAGCMGSADRLNYTVLGERVNLASRLSGQAGPGQIIIDQATRDQLAAQITATPLPGFNLKGFRDNVIAFELTAVHS